MSKQRKEAESAEATAPPETSAVAAPTPAPRVVGQHERAPAGLVRCKVRCDNYHPQPTRYILAASLEQAKQHYLRVQRLDELLERLARDGAKVEPPQLVASVLAD